MRSAVASGYSTILMCAVVVTPMVVLEIVNQGSQNFPYVLFAVLFLLTLAFISLYRTLRHAGSAGTTFIRIAALSVIAWIWLAIVADQMKCFLGFPNCD